MDPVLHRFLGHMAALEIDGRSPVPPADEDPWVTTVLEPRWDAMPAAEGALAAIAQNLPAVSAAVRPTRCLVLPAYMSSARSRVMWRACCVLSVARPLKAR